MLVSVQRPARPYADLADLTTKGIVRARWVMDTATGEESYEIEFDSDLTPAEASDVRLRLEAGSAIEETLHSRAVVAYKELLDFERNVSPTNADVVRVVRLLCKVARALIRLTLRRLDAID